MQVNDLIKMKPLPTLDSGILLRELPSIHPSTSSGDRNVSPCLETPTIKEEYSANILHVSSIKIEIS